MSQAQLDREVAHLTGESVSFIRSMGFSPLNPPYPPRPRKCARQAAVRLLRMKEAAPSDPMARKAA